MCSRGRDTCAVGGLEEREVVRTQPADLDGNENGQRKKRARDYLAVLSPGERSSVILQRLSNGALQRNPDGDVNGLEQNFLGPGMGR